MFFLNHYTCKEESCGINFSGMHGDFPNNWDEVRAQFLMEELYKIINLSDQTAENLVKTKLAKTLAHLDSQVYQEIYPLIVQITKYNSICVRLHSFHEMLESAYDAIKSNYPEDTQKYKSDFYAVQEDLLKKYGAIYDELENRKYLPFRVFERATFREPFRKFCCKEPDVLKDESPEFFHTLTYGCKNLKRSDFESTYAYFLKGFLVAEKKIKEAYADKLALTASIKETSGPARGDFRRM